MKRPYLLSALLAWSFCLLNPSRSHAQVCENLALDFDGQEDYVSLNTSNTPVSGNANFTVEAWFSIASPPATCANNFRRLFVLSGPVASRFELGECNGFLKLYWQTNAAVIPAPPPFVIETISGQLQGCHHIAVVRNGTAIGIYLDGGLTPLYSGVMTGALNTDLFRLGHWGFSQTTPGQDWLGTIDEVRLWSVPRSPQQIRDHKDCSLSGTAWPGLVANWTFNQPGIIPGGNNQGAVVTDMSGNGNDGAFYNGNNGFTLSGPASNFVCAPCSPALDLDIKDLGSQLISLISICSGTGAHFCLTLNGGQILGLGGATVQWEYFDAGGLNWTQITGNPVFNSNGFCFGVGPGNPALDIDCSNNAAGFVDRKFRAIITKGPPGQNCTFTSSEYLLRIHCPVNNAAISLSPPLLIPPTASLCEGDHVNTSVSLNSSHPFIPSGLPPAGDLNFIWCINGIHDPLLDNMPSFPYTGTAALPDLCFEAKIANGVCPLYQTTACIPVDPIPMCGIIDVVSALDPDPNGGPYDYLICPGDQAMLGMLNHSDFKNCTAVWQFSFDGVVWNDMLGTSNPVQNTNTLPQLSPAGPFTWPPNTPCIFYRIECRPLSGPNSGCPPCHSNAIRICLKTQKPPPVISAGQNPICKNGTTFISVSPYDPACTYTWYCDGLVVGNGPSIPMAMGGCYWVEVRDGCFLQTSQVLDLQACEIVPVIECPQDNPCACLGVPITLIGCNSYNTCGNTGPLQLTYTWTADTGGPVLPGPNGDCEGVHTPDPGGTNYTLTVTDPNIPCSVTTLQFFVKPCQ